MAMKRPGTLALALGASLAVHAVLLTVRFVDPARFDRVFQDTPLEVILVNSRSKDKPVNAQAIAQASLAGGGDADRGRATSPLPPTPQEQQGDAAEDAQRQVEALIAQQTQLLADVKTAIASLPPPSPEENKTDPEARQREDRRRQLDKLLAEIERRIQEENARPRKRYISPATREAVYAVYYDQLRRRIEARGTENFPESRGKKLYGELTLALTVNHDGRVLDTTLVQGSGNRTLDRRADAIARASGPFGTFSDEMRRKADQIVVVSRFRFTRDETLETQLSAAPR